jgi:chloride channel protein, CIC family
VHSGGVAGGGYTQLAEALNGQLPLATLLVLGVLKIGATIFSYSSGGAGGLFAPVLFVGAMLGGAVGWFEHHWLGHVEMGAFALVGMGALFAGVIRAPITSVLIIFEMTGGYGLVLPLMIANMTSYVIARRFDPRNLYDALLEQDGIHLTPATGDARELEEGRSEK